MEDLKEKTNIRIGIRGSAELREQIDTDTLESNLNLSKFVNKILCE